MPPSTSTRPASSSQTPTGLGKSGLVLGLVAATVLVDVTELVAALAVGHATGISLWAAALTVVTVVVLLAGSRQRPGESSSEAAR